MQLIAETLKHTDSDGHKCVQAGGNFQLLTIIAIGSYSFKIFFTEISTQHNDMF